MAARLATPLPAWPLLVLPAALVGMLAAANPALAVVVVLGAAFVVLTLSDLTLGLMLFTVLSFLELPGNPAFSFTKLAGLVLALSWLATVTRSGGARRDFFRAHPVAAYGLILFLAWAAISTLWAESPIAAVTDASRYGLNFVLLPIVYTAVRREHDAIWLAIAFVGGALLSAAYGFSATPPSPDDVERLTGAAGDANELASVLVAAVALAAGLALAARGSPALRGLAIGCLLGCVVGVFLSLSRTGLVALAAVLVLGLLVAGRGRAKVLAVVALLAVAGVSYFAGFATPEARERVTTIQGGSGRADLWTIGARMALDRPLTGVGAGNFDVSSPRYLVRPGAIVRDEFVLDQPKPTHNVYLQVLAELGLPGLVLFLGILGFALGCAVAAARSFARAKRPRMASVAWAFAIAAVGILVSDFFLSEQFSKQLWLLLSSGPALLALARGRG